ncbi:MAG: GatB/YqeY domain-containing protein, partial [Bacteroidetes bacterium]|nr:GatB/YqeY domain-containing protein [Bacteroidota bacterium]
MSIKQRLEADLKDAMRSRDSLQLATVRSMRAAIQKREIEFRAAGKELSEEDLIQVVQKEAKQRRESIEQFKAAERHDLVEKESGELAVIEKYLPAQMSESELEDRLRAIVAASGARSMADIGKVMGPAMAQLKGAAD